MRRKGDLVCFSRCLMWTPLGWFIFRLGSVQGDLPHTYVDLFTREGTLARFSFNLGSWIKSKSWPRDGRRNVHSARPVTQNIAVNSRVHGGSLLPTTPSSYSLPTSKPTCCLSPVLPSSLCRSSDFHKRYHHHSKRVCAFSQPLNKDVGFPFFCLPKSSSSSHLSSGFNSFTQNPTPNLSFNELWRVLLLGGSQIVNI